MNKSKKKKNLVNTKSLIKKKKNVNSSIFKKIDNNLEKEEPLLKKLNNCKTRKCKKYNKQKLIEQKHFEKEQDIQCQQKSDEEYYNCSKIFYDNSNYKKIFDKWVKCTDKKCVKEKNELNKFRDMQSSIN